MCLFVSLQLLRYETGGIREIRIAAATTQIALATMQIVVATTMTTTDIAIILTSLVVGG